MHHWIMGEAFAGGKQPGIVNVQALVVTHHPCSERPETRKQSDSSQYHHQNRFQCEWECLSEKFWQLPCWNEIYYLFGVFLWQYMKNLSGQI